MMYVICKKRVTIHFFSLLSVSDSFFLSKKIIWVKIYTYETTSCIILYYYWKL